MHSPSFNIRPSLPLKILIRQDDIIIFRSYHQLASPVNSARSTAEERGEEGNTKN